MSDQRWKLVRAHIAKGDKAKTKADDHYIAAGLVLADLKAEHTGTWEEWEVKVKEQAGIGKSRASELMQIADGRKTPDEVRADTSHRQQEHRAALRYNGGNAPDPEASAEAMKAKFAALDDDGPSEPKAALEEQDDEFTFGSDSPSAMAALRMVKQMSEEDRESFFQVLEGNYPEDYGPVIYEDDNDLGIVRTIVMAIGAERTRSLAKKIPRLVLQAVGKQALPDCQWCQGSGHKDAELLGIGKGNVPCECIRRKRGEDFEALRARLERENKAQEIPQQDFSFGVEVRTSDGRVWTSGVRLPTEEEAGFYIDYWARRELRVHGYQRTYEDQTPSDLVGFDIKRYDDQPMMKITGGIRKTLHFLHGTCGSLGWRPISGGECDVV
jgi:hypothetical protein